MADAERAIAPGLWATIRLRIATPDGEVIEETDESEPLGWEVGDGTLAEGIEQRLIGLTPGMSAEWLLEEGEAFGDYQPERRQWMERTDFPLEMSERLEPGLVVSFNTPTGEEWYGRVMEVTIDRVKIDFNHPLAGRSVRLEVAVVAVTPGKVAGDGE